MVFSFANVCLVRLTFDRSIFRSIRYLILRRTFNEFSWNLDTAVGCGDTIIFCLNISNEFGYYQRIDIFVEILRS